MDWKWYCHGTLIGQQFGFMLFCWTRNFVHTLSGVGTGIGPLTAGSNSAVDCHPPPWGVGCVRNATLVMFYSWSWIKIWWCGLLAACEQLWQFYVFIDSCFPSVWLLLMIFVFSQAYIATIVSRSNPSSPNWNVIVKLNDGTGTVDADLSEKVKNALC